MGILVACLVCLIPIIGIFSVIYCTYYSVKEYDNQLDILHHGEHK